MPRKEQTFSFSGGKKICELFPNLDDNGKFLYSRSVRSGDVGIHKSGMADGNAVGSPIKGYFCWTILSTQQTCEGCKMLNYYQNSAEK